MIEEGIMYGDLAAIKPGISIENGQIAVVLLDDQATSKRVHLQKDRMTLKPANKAAVR